MLVCGFFLIAQIFDEAVGLGRNRSESDRRGRGYEVRVERMKHRKDFDCVEALGRLVERCPGLRDDSEVAALLLAQGGSGIEENRFLEVVQDLVIRPDVGLAALGCFRPILARVLDTLILSLRQLWRQGRVSFGREGEGFVGISTRLRNGGGWDLGLHEYTCIMLSRLLDLAPYLLRCVFFYSN